MIIAIAYGVLGLCLLGAAIANSMMRRQLRDRQLSDAMNAKFEAQRTLAQAVKDNRDSWEVSRAVQNLIDKSIACAKLERS
jgi:hypothetical protein